MYCHLWKCCWAAVGLFLGIRGPAKADYTYTPIDVPGASLTEAHGINGSGQIVGRYVDASGGGHGFLLDIDGTYITLDVPGATGPYGTYAFGINTSGQIVGYYVDVSGISRGFLLDVDGTYTTLDVPGAIDTEAFGINDSGQIVGYYVDFICGNVAG